VPCPMLLLVHGAVVSELRTQAVMVETIRGEAETTTRRASAPGSSADVRGPLDLACAYAAVAQTRLLDREGCGVDHRENPPIAVRTLVPCARDRGWTAGGRR
jgi:hypothetical protein